MIRRGLQILIGVGVITLGAAPSFGQFQGSPPSTITVSGAPDEFLNRTWYYDAPDGEDFTYFSGELGSGWPLRVNVDLVHAYFWLGDPEGNDSVEREYVILLDGTWSETITATGGVASTFAVVWEGGGFGPGFSATDPYPDNFPDWESAAVKIPLGFGFAMAFWAVAVAASMAMRWVRDLASVAT